MKCSAPQALCADGQRRRDTCEPEYRNWPADIFKCRTLRLPDQEKAARPQTRRLSRVLYDWLCASLRLIKRSMLPCPLRLEGGMEGRLRVRAPRFPRKTRHGGEAQSASAAFSAQNASESEYRQARSGVIRRLRSNVSKHGRDRRSRAGRSSPGLAEGAFHRAQRAAAFTAANAAAEIGQVRPPIAASARNFDTTLCLNIPAGPAF